MLVRKPIELRGNCRSFEGIKQVRIAQTDGNRCFIAGQEIEVWDRFGISDEGDGLLYKQIVKSGGRDLTREEVFPLQGTDGNTRVVK
jgi:hypothetical protein